MVMNLRCQKWIILGCLGALMGCSDPFAGTWFATPVARLHVAPSGVFVASGNSQATVSWTAVSGATSYNLYYSTTSGVTKSTGTKVAGVASPYTLTGLTNGTTYYFIVTAITADGESPASIPVSVVLLQPATPPSAVGAPVYSLGSGDHNYVATLTVSVSSPTPGASVKYTTDGTDPKTSSAAQVGTTIPLTTSKSIRAYAYKAGMNDSGESDGNFNIFKTFVYWGDTGSNQVFKYEADLTTGNLTNLQSFANSVSYSNSLAIDPGKRQLYTACSGSHSLSVFPVNADGSLGTVSMYTVIGDSTDRLTLHPTVKWLYGVGSSGLFGLDVTVPMTLTNLFQYITTPLPDTTLFDDVADHSGRYLYALYRGTTHLACWGVDPLAGTLTYRSEVSSNDPGTNAVGVLALHPTLPALYVLSPWQVNSYTMDPTTGALTVGTVDSTFGNAVGLAADPLGKFLFCATQESSPSPNDSINVYSLDQNTGLIVPNGGLAHYNGTASGTSFCHLMAVDPTGSFLYDYTGDTNKIQVFSINRTTGALTDLALVQPFPGTQAAEPVFLRIKQ